MAALRYLLLLSKAFSSGVTHFSLCVAGAEKRQAVTLGLASQQGLLGVDLPGPVEEVYEAFLDAGLLELAKALRGLQQALKKIAFVPPGEAQEAVIEAVKSEIRAHVAADVVTGSHQSALLGLLQRFGDVVSPAVRQLLELALQGAKALRAAEAAAAAEEALHRGDADLASAAGAKARVARALAEALEGETVESRIRRLCQR